MGDELLKARLAWVLAAVGFSGIGCSKAAAPGDGGADGGGGVCSGPASSRAPTFGPAIEFLGDGGSSYGIVTSGDLNGDGFPDLLAPHGPYNPTTPSETANIFFGLEDGGLSTPKHFAATYFAAPFDPDSGAAFGAIDLQYSAIHLFASDGREVWSHKTSSPVYSFAAADLNRDGKPDLALCELGGVEAILNLGSGAFSDPVALAPGSACLVIAAADLDQDGIPDLVVPGFGGYDVGVLIGQPDGGFSTSGYPTGPGQMGTSVLLRDLNGDGLPDIVVASQSFSGGLPPQGLFVLLNQGGGKFGSATSYPVGYPRQVIAADFNGDCWPDLLAIEDTSCGRLVIDGGSGVFLFLNRGDGTFSVPLEIDAGLPEPGGVGAYYGGGAALPSIALAGGRTGRFEILPSTTQP